MKTPRTSIRKSIIDSPCSNFTPLRRSIVASTPLVNENANDDDSERFKYRRNRGRYVQQQEVDATLSAQKESLPIEYLKQHFDTCLRMAAENKINQKNVWQIHVIDYLKTVLDESMGNTLQLARTGLEVSAKVYAMRVDSVHAQALKITGELGRQGVVRDNEGHTSDNEALLDDTAGLSADDRARGKSQKKRKTVLADPASLLGEIEVYDLMDPIFLQSVSKGSDVNAADALFQANMDVNTITSELMLMTDTLFWNSTEMTEEIRKAPDSGSIKIPPLTMKQNTHICPAFALFSLVDWDVNKEGNVSKELSLMQRDDYAFNMDAEPLPVTEVPMDTSHIDSFFDSEISEKSRITLNIPSDNDLETDYNNVLKIVLQNNLITSPTIHKPLKTYGNRKKIGCFKSLSFNESVISQLDTFSWTESVPESVFKCSSDDSPVRKSNLLSPINSVVKTEFNDSLIATSILSEFEDLVLKTEHDDEIKCSTEDIGKDANLNDNLKWELDDLIWARIGNYPFWPCVICLDPEKNIYFMKKVQSRSKAPMYNLHVRFFGDGGRRSWVAEHLILRYEGKKALFEISKQIKSLKTNQKLLNAFVVPERNLHKWETAVAEIELYSLSSKEEREMFFNQKIEPKSIKYSKRKREEGIEVRSNVKKQKTAIDCVEIEERKKLTPKENKNVDSNNRTLRQRSSPKPPAENNPDINEISKRNLKLRSDKKNDIMKPANDNKDSLEEFIEKITYLIKKRRPNLFKGATREHVCVRCEKPGDVYKCNGVCKRYYHLSCVELLKNGVLQLVPTGQQLVQGGQELDTEENEPKSSKRKLSIAEQIDAKMREIMDEIGTMIKYSDSTEESSSDSETNTTTSEIKFHVTGDGVFHDKKEKKQRSDVELYCADCSQGVLPPCFVCAHYIQPERQSTKLSLQEESANCESVKVQNLQENDTSRSCSVDTKVNLRNRQSNTNLLNSEMKSTNLNSNCVNGNTNNKSNEEYRQKCSLYHCTKFYHPACLKTWPQAEWSLSSTKSFLCPYHSCHTCISDNPRGSKPRFNNEKLAKCIRCPTTYHLSNFCIPAGTNILNANHIICPKHTEEDLVKTHHINTNWCFICSEGGSLICCETCPTSFHAECLNIKFPEGSYICEDCESGRYPLYNEVIWVKLGKYRWWPGQILFPEDVPDNVRAIVHNRRDFVVRFFGSHDHYWVNKSRVFLYQEGDSGHSDTKKTNVNRLFVRANEEAVIAHRLFKEMQAHREAETNSGLKPPPFIKIKTNKLVGNVKSFELHPNSMTSCDCDPKSENPCGPDTDCLNRLLLTECSPQVCPAGDHCQNQNFEKRLYPALVPFRTAAGRGWGLKTLESLSKGRFVIEYVGEMIDETEYRRRLQHMSEMKDENYYFLTIDKDRMLDAGPKGNVARFMNHSCEPNCETQKWTVNGDTRVGLFALKDIAADTELTFNYNLECVGKEMKPCQCGTSKCSGFIGGKIKQNEAPKVEKKVAKVKKNKKNKQQLLNNCFACSKPNTEVQCSVKYCMKKYHLECAGLASSPVDRYSCIRHSCQICSKKYVKMCFKCVNSYCTVHKKSNMEKDASTGAWQCMKHKKKKSKNVVKGYGISTVENNQEVENGEQIDEEEESDKKKTERQKGKNSQEKQNDEEEGNNKKKAERQKGKNSQQKENDGEEENDKKKTNRQKSKNSQEMKNILDIEKLDDETLNAESVNDKKNANRPKDKNCQDVENILHAEKIDGRKVNNKKKTNRQNDKKSQERENVEKIDEDKIVMEEANDKKKTNRQIDRKSKEIQIVLNVEKIDKERKIVEQNINDKKKMNRQQKDKKSQELENVKKNEEALNEHKTFVDVVNDKKRTKKQKVKNSNEVENVVKTDEIVREKVNFKKKTNIQKIRTRQNVKNDRQSKILTEDKINIKIYKKKCKVLSGKVIKKKMLKKNIVLINNCCKKLRSFKKNR